MTCVQIFFFATKIQSHCFDEQDCFQLFFLGCGKELYEFSGCALRLRIVAAEATGERPRSGGGSGLQSPETRFAIPAERKRHFRQATDKTIMVRSVKLIPALEDG